MLIRTVTAMVRTVEDTFKDMASQPGLILYGAMMMALLDELVSLDAPPVWAYIKGGELMLSDRNSPIGGRRVYVGVSLSSGADIRSQYEITYFHTPPMSAIVVFADDSKVATQMLCKAMEETADPDAFDVKVYETLGQDADPKAVAQIVYDAVAQTANPEAAAQMANDQLKEAGDLKLNKPFSIETVAQLVSVALGEAVDH